MANTNTQSLFNLYRKHNDYVPVYGTAGFRDDASLLSAIVFRCGVLMGIKSIQCQKTCGVMITASHNKESDNGVKLVDYTGDMIDDTWQQHATQLAQAETYAEFQLCINKIMPVGGKPTSECSVLVAIDTRKSGIELMKACIDGIESVGVNVVKLGVVTTPELHFNVVKANANVELNYIQHLEACFKSLNKINLNYRQINIYHVDCANGVGYLRMQELKPCLASVGIRVELYNHGDGELNHMCGADFVEKEVKFPKGMHDVPENAKCCSIDGDADRIVFFTKRNGEFHLINGDKIACLFATYIQNKVSKYATTYHQPKLGIVQTAYANGASSNYIKNNLGKIDLVYADTGVSYLHKKAKLFDIGIYFEANGHGTVLFNPDYLKDIQNTRLGIIAQLLNQNTGDALADMLLVEVILQDYSFFEWIDMYTDLYCKQSKIHVDRTAFQTKDFGRVCIKPVGLQEEIDSIVSQYPKARAFVRPSGTENIVRLYVECQNQDDIDVIVSQITDKVIIYA